MAGLPSAPEIRSPVVPEVRFPVVPEIHTHVLAEFDCLDQLLSALRLDSGRLKCTCLAVSRKWLALGTSAGGVHLIQREGWKQRLILTHKEGSITQVCCCPHDEDFIAVATSQGLVVVWELQQERRGRPERVSLSWEHRGQSVTSVVWDCSGLRVFIGDSVGKVSFLRAASSKMGKGSAFVMFPVQTVTTVDSRVVQLGYHDGRLLVSSLSRCYLCDTDKEKFWRVGNKERDGEYGACFFPQSRGGGGGGGGGGPLGPAGGPQPHPPPLLYCARPGSRVWEASFSGEVLSTHQFKQLLAFPPLPIITYRSEPRYNPAQKNSQSIAFPKLLYMGEQHLLTWSHSAIYILTPGSGQVLLWSQISDVVEVAAYRSELFCLHGDGRLSHLSLLSVERCVERLLRRDRYSLAAAVCCLFPHAVTAPRARKSVPVDRLDFLRSQLSAAAHPHLIGQLDEVIARLEPLDSASSSRRSSISSHESFNVLDCGIYRVISRRGSQSDEDGGSLVNQSVSEEERLRDFGFGPEDEQQLDAEGVVSERSDSAQFLSFRSKPPRIALQAVRDSVSSFVKKTTERMNSLQMNSELWQRPPDPREGVEGLNISTLSSEDDLKQDFADQLTDAHADLQELRTATERAVSQIQDPLVLLEPAHLAETLLEWLEHLEQVLGGREHLEQVLGGREHLEQVLGSCEHPEETWARGGRPQSFSGPPRNASEHPEAFSQLPPTSEHPEASGVPQSFSGPPRNAWEHPEVFSEPRQAFSEAPGHPRTFSEQQPCFDPEEPEQEVMEEELEEVEEGGLVDRSERGQDVEVVSSRPLPSEEVRPLPSEEEEELRLVSPRPLPSEEVRPLPSEEEEELRLVSPRPLPSEEVRPLPSEEVRPLPSEEEEELRVVSSRPLPSEEVRPLPSEEEEELRVVSPRPLPSDLLDDLTQLATLYLELRTFGAQELFTKEGAGAVGAASFLRRYFFLLDQERVKRMCVMCFLEQPGLHASFLSAMMELTDHSKVVEVINKGDLQKSLRFLRDLQPTSLPPTSLPPTSSPREMQPTGGAATLLAHLHRLYARHGEAALRSFSHFYPAITPSDITPMAAQRHHFLAYLDNLVQSQAEEQRLCFLGSLLQPESLRQDWLQLALTHDAPGLCDTRTADGQPRWHSHYLSWGYGRLLSLLTSLPADLSSKQKMAESCRSHGYWTGYMRVCCELGWRAEAFSTAVQLDDISLLEEPSGLEPQTVEEWRLLVQLSQQSSQQTAALPNGSADAAPRTREVTPETLTLRLARMLGPQRALGVLQDAGGPQQALGALGGPQREDAGALEEPTGGPQRAPGAPEEPTGGPQQLVLSEHSALVCHLLAVAEKRQRSLIHTMLERCDRFLWSQHA